MITTAFKNLQSFVKKNYPTGLIFNFEGKGKWEDILSGNVIEQKKE